MKNRLDLNMLNKWLLCHICVKNMLIQNEWVSCNSLANKEYFYILIYEAETTARNLDMDIDVYAVEYFHENMIVWNQNVQCNKDCMQGHSVLIFHMTIGENLLNLYEWNRIYNFAAENNSISVETNINIGIALTNALLFHYLVLHVQIC